MDVRKKNMRVIGVSEEERFGWQQRIYCGYLIHDAPHVPISPLADSVT